MGSAVVEGYKDNERQPRLIHYYYINYKQFVNVIKYKLDQMTKKVEAEERKVHECACLRYFTMQVMQTVCVCVCGGGVCLWGWGCASVL